MILGETAKYLKIGKSTLYKMARKSKISTVKMDFGGNNKVINCLPHNQEFIRKVKTISGERRNSSGKYLGVPSIESLIEKLRNLFGESLGVDLYFYFLYFYLIPLQRELSIRKYSRRTIKSYIGYNRDFLLFAGKKPEEIKNEDIKKYLYYMVRCKKVSISTLNIIINALNFFYGQILNKRFTY